MNKNGNKQMFESYKIFPYIAWGLVIGFALFVYNITQELKEVSEELKERSVQLNTDYRLVNGLDVNDQ